MISRQELPTGRLRRYLLFLRYVLRDIKNHTAKHSRSHKRYGSGDWLSGDPLPYEKPLRKPQQYRRGYDPDLYCDLCTVFQFSSDLFYRVHKPLKEILKGALEFANGNLTYTIPVDSDDEMGYLSHSLNYMADKLNKNGEYQRQFISNVSHDFRSPLTSIKGYVEAMLDGTIPPEMQERYLKVIAFESTRLEKLTRSLLTLNELDVKKRMMHMRRFDINETIRTTAATFEGTCSERNIRLELLLAGKELFVRADMEQIQQVLYNLLDNAVKFSSDNSSITLETTVNHGKVLSQSKTMEAEFQRKVFPESGTVSIRLMPPVEKTARYRAWPCHCKRDHQRS